MPTHEVKIPVSKNSKLSNIKYAAIVERTFNVFNILKIIFMIWPVILSMNKGVGFLNDILCNLRSYKRY